MQGHNLTDSLRNFQDASYGYGTRSTSRDGLGWCCRKNDVQYVDISVNAELPPLLIFKDVPIRWGWLMLVVLSAINSQSNDEILRNNDLVCCHYSYNRGKVLDCCVGFCFCWSPVLQVLPLLQWCKSVLQVVSTTQHHCRVWSKVLSTTTVTTPNSDVMMIIPVYCNIGLIFIVLVSISIVYFSITH